MVGIRREPGVVDRLDLRVLLEPLRERRRVLTVALHPERQVLERDEVEPGVERRHRRTGLPQQHMDVILDELLGCQDNAAETAALAVDMFRRRIDDAVGAERERALPDRRGEDVPAGTHDL